MTARRRPRSDAKGVVASNEAMVEGRYAEYLEQQGHPVPTWAWMNLLAHGPAEMLRRTAAQPPAPWRRRAGSWHRARAYLAGEVLDAASRFGTLRSVQAEVLVPLELELMARSGSTPRTPGEWAAWVLSALQSPRPGCHQR